MKNFLAALIAGVMLAASLPAMAQNCQYDSDRAADGSRCGKRSADSRSGGK